MKKETSLHCGSAHCRGGHVWVFKGTKYERLSSINCYPEKQYTDEELKAMNECKDLFGTEGKPIWSKIRSRVLSNRYTK